MQPLAGVMRDLELVLLQTSMSDEPDAASLAAAAAADSAPRSADEDERGDAAGHRLDDADAGG